MMLRNFILFSFTLFATTLYALQGGPTQPDYAQFEPADMPDLVSMQTGDFVYSLPLGELPGPYGNYPLSVAYHAGISPQQEATWVGLGWTLNPGVINRDVRGVPDDQFHGGTLGFLYQYSAMQTWALDLGWSYGIFSAGITATSSGGVGFSATVGPKIAGVAGVGFTVGTDAVGFQASVGSEYGGLNAGLLFSTTDGTPLISAGVSVGNGVEVSAGIQYTPGQKVSHDVGFAVTEATGNTTDARGNTTTSFTRVGVNVSSSGVRVGVINGVAESEGKAVSTNGGILSVSNSKSNKGKWNTSSVGFAIIIPTYVGVFSLGFSQALHEYWSRSATSDYVYGYIYQAGPAIVADGANKIAELPYASAESYKSKASIPWKWTMKGRTLEALGSGGTVPAYDMYSVSSEGVSGSFRPFARESHQLYQKVSDEKTAENTIETYNTMLVDSADGWPYVNEFTLTNDTVQTSEYPSYDYCVHSDSCSPYALYATLFRNEGNRLIYRRDKDAPDTVHSGMTFLFAGESGGYFESDTLGEDRGHSKKSVSSRLLRREINGYQYALYGSRKVEPVFEDDSPVGKLKGFVVTGSDGTEYYFEQPVRSYFKVDYSINQEKGSPVFVDKAGDKTDNFLENLLKGYIAMWTWFAKRFSFTENIKAIKNLVAPAGTLKENCTTDKDGKSDDYFYSYQVNMNPYATQWLLTEIRGADFVKLGDSIENNVGYNVKFHYTEPQIYRWRTPFARPGLKPEDMPNFREPKDGYTPKGCDSRMYQASFGVKEYVYLKSIETATHRAEFILNDSAKEERVDGKGWDVSVNEGTGQLPIFVQASVGMKGTSENGVSEYPILFSTYYAKSIRLTPEWLYVYSELPDEVLNALKRSRVIRVMGLDSLSMLTSPEANKIYGNSMLTFNVVDTADVMRKTTGNESRYGLYKIRISAASEEPYSAKIYFDTESDAKGYSMNDSLLVFGENGNYTAAPYVNWGDLIWAGDSLNLAENRMRYLKEIDFYNKADSEPYRKFAFGYDYSLQPKTLNSYCSGRYPDTTADILKSPDSAALNVCSGDTASRYLYGKLALKSVTETGCRNGRCASLPPFRFAYNSPSESSTRVSTKDGWVSLSQGLSAYVSSSGDTSSVAQFPDAYYENITDVDASIIASSNAIDEWGFWDYYANAENHKTTQSIADYDAAAWSLNKVTDPAGGVLTVEYERDVYGDGENYGDETKFVNVVGYGSCSDYSNMVSDDSVSYFRDKSYGVPDSLSDKLCIEVGKLYWRELCLGPQVAHWDTLRPAGYTGTGFEYLDSLGVGGASGQNLFYNLKANMRTNVRCGLFGRNHCARTRSIAVFGDGHYRGKLSSDDGSRKLLILDRKWDEVHEAAQRAADKINDRSWHLEGGGSRMGFLWKKDSLPQMKGGDLRVTRLTRYDIDRTAQTEYEYGVGELAQLPDSAYNTVLGNRFYASKISYALPDVDMRPKSRIVGFDDDDLFYVPGPRITYPKVTVRNTDSDGGTLNGRTEFSYITPETGVPAEFVDSMTRAELVPFMKVNARLLRWGGDVHDDDYGYRGFLVGFTLYDSLMNPIGQTRSVVIHEGEVVPIVFYAQNIRNARHLVAVSKYREESEAVSGMLSVDAGLTDFNEMGASVLWDIKNNQVSLHPSWLRSQKEGFYPILYRKVEYAPDSVSLIAIVDGGASQNALADYEKSVTYHDLTAFLGLNFRTAFYRGNGDNAIPIKVDSSIYSTIVPDVMDGVDNTGASSVPRPLSFLGKALPSPP